MSTQPTDAELDSVDMDAKAIANQNPIGTPFAWRKAYLTALARAVLARWGQPAPVGVEPYGWHYWSIAGTSAFHLVRSNRLDADIAASTKHPDAHHIVPLYIHPQPMPLTDEQIKGLIEEGAFFGNCKEIVRAIEAAHGIGIKGGQHGAE